MPLILFLLFGLLVAWGIRFVPSQKQWLPIFLGKRLHIRLLEGPVWLPRWLYTYTEVPITENELVVLRDDQEPGRQSETIMTTNGVMVEIRNVSVFWSIKRQDDQPFKGWRKILSLLGWHPGNQLFDFTQIGDKIFTERIKTITLQEQRKHVQVYSFQELLGITLEGLDMPAADRDKVIATRSELHLKIAVAVNQETNRWGAEIYRVSIGDIDPDPVIKKALEEKTQALGHKMQVMVRLSADLERVKQLLELANQPATSENIMKAYELIRSLDNNRIGNEQLGLLADVFKRLAGRPVAEIIPKIAEAMS